MTTHPTGGASGAPDTRRPELEWAAIYRRDRRRIWLDRAVIALCMLPALMLLVLIGAALWTVLR